MNKKLKKILIMMLILLCSTSAMGLAETSETVILKPGFNIAIVSGNEMIVEAIPYIENSTTMVPLRFFCENVLKASVHWDSPTNQIYIYDGIQSLTINLNDNYVVSDGAIYKMPMPAVVKSGSTYLPLRQIAELFNSLVYYDQVEKTVTISTKSTTPPKEIEIIDPPISGFELPRNFIAGQKFTFKNTSYDPGSYGIVEASWEVTKEGKTTQTKDLTAIMGKALAGTYEISLRVKNAAGIWSDKSIQVFTIHPNQPPVVTKVNIDKKEIAKGERFNLSHTVENEEWEKITEEVWSYSWFDGEKQRTLPGKPWILFMEGPHKISVKVKDEYGNWSQVKEFEIDISERTVFSEERYKFTNLIPGEFFFNHGKTNYNLVPNAKILEVGNEEVTLIASNNPEKVDAKGILYQDEASGVVRVRYHHRNMLPKNLRVFAIAENTSKVPVEVEILKNGQAGPSLDIMQVGQQVVVNYLKDQSTNQNKKVTIKPGERLVLNPDQRALKNDEVAAGLIDLRSSGKLLFTIVGMDDVKNPTGYRNLEILPKINSHIRGTFNNAGIKMDILVSGKETEKVIIGRNDAYAGHFLKGFENTTGEYLINNGNRGVAHTLTITAEEKVGVLLNPRGTIYKGSLLGFDGQITLLSNSGILYGIQDAAVLGVLEKGETKTITYVPPSGSDSPVLLVFIPEKEW